MPAQAADLEEALNKKGGLTLSQLANYDDIITDALVDKVYFWSTIRKLKSTYHGQRGLGEEAICKILQEEVVINKDAAAAQEKLLKLPGVTKYHNSLKTEDEKEHFLRHMRKYINIYLPECPFEVGTTNRYTITTAEASIISRKVIRRGEPIKYLSGIQVELSEKEEKELGDSTDFSIVLSSRRKRPSLFLGPARFANHDCDSNAKLTTTGPHGIYIVARKDIAVGDEITVTYGADYFGEDNCECLCGTCERLTRNGWDPRGPIIHDDSSDEDDSEEEVEIEPRTPPKRKVETSRPLKRKREEGDRGEDDQRPMKRGRGRPRKYPRADEPAATPVTVKIEPEEEEQAQDDDRGLSTERAFKRLTNGKGPESTTPPKSRGKLVMPTSAPAKAQSSKHTLLIPATRDSDEPLFYRLMRIVDVGADRTHRRKTGLSASHVFDLNSADTGSALSEVDFTQIGDFEIREQITSNNRVVKRGRGGLFVSKKVTASSESARTSMSSTKASPSSASTSTIEPISTTSTDLSKSQLPALRKDRSFSNLRNVINANDSQTDPYSIQSSPASSMEPPKRKRGRPRKYPRPEDSTEATGGSSPSSMGTDSSSSASLASTNTTLETFSAGAIAQGICEMYTRDIDVTEEPRAAQVTRRTSARLSVTVVEDEQTSIPEKTERSGDTRRRKSQRGRVSATDQSTGPIQSIEKNDDGEGDDDDNVQRGDPRTPGDYTLCRALLATAYHRWVECRNCDEHFVQSEAYLTRIACPRCERHSKLYGYYWPKTDREGKHDMEKRILDHREIHRFIPPDEEREERKGRKTLADVVKEKEMSECERSMTDDRDEIGRMTRRGKISPRRSESRIKRKTM